MIGTTYKKLRLLFCCLILCSINYTSSFGQGGTVRITVSELQAVNNSFCTTTFLGIPLEIGQSDFVWEVKLDDGQGNSNTNPSVPVLLGQLGGQSNHFYKNNDNGPYTGTPGAPNGIDFNPGNGRIFDLEYPCGVPASISVDWRAYENDDPTNYSTALNEGNTGTQTFALTVPTVGASASVQQIAFGGNNCNNTQEYRITFFIEHIPLAVTAVPDGICNAVQLPTNNTVQQFAWCGNQTLEPGEPSTNLGDNVVSTHGSAWFYFIAPASGQVKIETDLGGTDFGTEFFVYHAADGPGCIHGSNNWVGFPGINPIKTKFDYLSYIDEADDDIPLINSNVKATGFFSSIGNAFPSIRDDHALLAGETYYIQLTTDHNAQRGYISLRIEDLGGSPYAPHDIPCQGTDLTADAQSTTVRTEIGGQPFSTQLYRGNLTSSVVDNKELGAPYTGTDGTQYKAYDYTPALPNGLDGSMWVQFMPSNSGRIYIETDIDAGFIDESENLALYAPDTRFAPGTPADLFCSNISQIREVEGGGGVVGATQTAIIMEQCLEPGYTYYGMVDPQAATLAEEAEVWVYDPSGSDPGSNPPPNDILCLTMADTLFEIPVKPANQTIPFSAVAGDNTNACIETLAGEPFSNATPANRADQTVWHFFTVPPSGVVEMKIRAYIGLTTLNYAVYPLHQDSLCYGGLLPATFTTDGTQASNGITAIASGTTDFAGDIVGLCCLTPGTVYAIQLDGGSPGDIGQYIIEYINEIEVYAGDAQATILADTFNHLAVDTGYVCFGDTLIPSVMVDGLGNSTTNIANCMDIGYVVHDSLNIPDSIINGNFTFIDSVYLQPQYWVNDGTNPITGNTVHYVSPMADEQATWGQLTCPSASAENGTPFVFLDQINLVTAYNSTSCIIDFTATGGFPAYNGSMFDYLITNAAGDTVAMGQVANAALNQFAIPVADIYTIVITDNVGCNATAVVNASLCSNPCINNPVIITPDPLDSTIYTCYPGGDSAMVTILLNGGEPSATVGENYTSIVSGSTAPGASNTYTTVGTGAPAATPLSFTVMDGDAWMVIVTDVNGCADTVSGTFDYNLTNCSNYCTLNPIVSSFSYDCNLDGTALVQVTVGGGTPAIDGSSYTANIAGSTIFGQNFQNAQLPGTIGGTATFSFVVDDGDSWVFDVYDNNMCTDTLQDLYVFDTAHCPICTMIPVEFFPDPVDSSVYTCNSNGEAVVTLFLTGGAPSINSSQYTVTVSGSTVAGQNGSSTQNVGIFSFTVADGDNWTAIAVDDNTCADTVSGTFLYNSLNLDVTASTYTCYLDKSADVTLQLSGGVPSIDGSNYSVTIVGSSTPGASGYQIPVAGTIGGTTNYTFNVQDGDTWVAVVTDNSNCGVDSVGGTFMWNLTNCGNLCNDPAYTPVLINGNTGNFQYVCGPGGSGTVQLTLTGGLPQATLNDSYLVGLTINGSLTTIPVGLDSASTAASFTVNLSNNDIWSVMVYDSLQCDTSMLNGVFTSVDAVATLIAVPNFTLGQTATLDGSSSTGNNMSYVWTPANYIDNPNAITTTTTPFTSTTFTLTVQDTVIGCTDSDDVYLEVGRCVPHHSGFTPNGDGVNDLWEIPCLNAFTNRVQVFNRWGQKVFEAENYDSTWDGKNLGQDVPDATYYYVIEIDNPLYPSPTIYKGTVTIIR